MALNSVKLDFSQMKYSSFVNHNAVYKSLKNASSFEKLNKNELNKLDENLKPKELDEKVKEAQKELQTIYFRDPITHNLVQSALSEESLEILKENFGSQDFYQRKDKSYILSGQSEKFVSAWYGDIAYQRGYLKADSNNDGFMEKSELDETRSGFNAGGYMTYNGDKILSFDHTFTESYIEIGSFYTSKADGLPANFKVVQKTLYNEGKFTSPTLALELDKTIKNDKNLDGIVEYGEALSYSERVQDAKDGAEEHFTRVGGDPFANAKTIIDFLMEELENLDLINKLKQEGIEGLNKEELEKLKSNFPELFDTNGSFKQEEFDKFFEDFKDKFLEKSASFLGIDKSELEKKDFQGLVSVVKDIALNLSQNTKFSLSVEA
ncbi:hypothetical protein DMB92_07515 [Campylobacter sp. MIT 99-7217]|uniref:hypothetical protein n=1 Tax=Campylobacter sp. MIT 99-7217 TaxID=535091 RepID=UPI001159D245|nr:hypothetical protein [Campylobacter sp. MIT 99-7217]TQR30657.1 hypothetical protein DMB92_07515 [Campylobacter sp. MIT 99-7217]